jgi:hypothetical protein
MGIYNEETTIFLVAVSDNYDRSQELAFLISETLEGHHEQETEDHYQVRLTDSTETDEDEKYIQVLQFHIY